jgi:hypothetical protein
VTNSEVKDVATPRVERTDSLDQFGITDSLEGLRIPPDSVRHIVRVNSSEDIVVESSGLPTRPFTGPKGQDPFWTTGIFRRISLAQEKVLISLSHLSHPKHLIQTWYLLLLPILFLVRDAQPTDHILTIPLQMDHYTIIPDTTNLHNRNTVAMPGPHWHASFSQTHPDASSRISCVECFYSHSYTNPILGLLAFPLLLGTIFFLGFIPTLPQTSF